MNVFWNYISSISLELLAIAKRSISEFLVCLFFAYEPKSNKFL